MLPQQGALDLRPDVPFTRNHASYLAALRLATKPERRQIKTRIYLAVLAEAGDGLTDREAMAAMAAKGCRVAGPSSICSIRSHAMACGLVEQGALVEGNFGAKNYKWQFTSAGRLLANDV